MLLRGMNPKCWRRMRSPHRRTPRRWRWRPTAACRCCVPPMRESGGAEGPSLYRRLLDEGLFRRLVIIERAGRERRYQVVELC
ncbi:hypothetical protein M5E87_21830 [Flavonifractor plautii]|nr:hypothetical protein M5E87_21830 [Flavonifractor plautii]